MEAKSLIDDMLKSTFRFGRRVRDARVRAFTEEALIKYRMAALKAQRFYLDDEFVTLAHQTSLVPAEEQSAAIALAQLPYENTWIEFNTEAKVRAQAVAGIGQPDHNANPHTDRLGILMMRDKERPTACSMTIFAKMKDIDDVVPVGFTYLFDTVGGSGATVVGEHKTFTFIINNNAVMSDRIMKGIFGAGWGYGTNPFATSGPIEGIELYSNTPHCLMNHTGLAFDYMTGHYIEELKRSGASNNVMTDYLTDLLTSLMNHAGMLRFLVTVLAMMNAAPIKTREARPQGSTIVGMSRKPFSTYKVLSLDYKKSIKVEQIRKALKKQERCRHRRHDVRAHDRHYYNKDGSLKKVLRIHEHQRGDAALGYVVKDYNLRSGM